MIVRKICSAMMAAVGAMSLPAHAATSIAASLPTGNYFASTSALPGGAESAFNGGTWSATLGAPQWIQVDLGSVQPIGTVALKTQFGSPTSTGGALYGIFLTNTGNVDYSGFVGSPYASISGNWLSGTELSFALDYLNLSVRYVAIVVNTSTTAPALSDVRIYSPVPEAGTAVMLLLGLAVFGLVGRRLAELPSHVSKSRGAA